MVSSSVRYSRLSLLRPARGCNCDGSAKADGLRKESTPWAVEGSKGVGAKVSVVVGVEDGLVAEAGDDDDEDDEDFWEEDFRPVSASQIDIFSWPNYDNTVKVEKIGRSKGQ